MTQNRNEIPAKYKWDTRTIYPTREQFDADFAQTEQDCEAFTRHKETMTASPEGLYNMLCDFFAIQRRIMKLYEYAARNFDVDTSQNEWQAVQGKVADLFRKFGQSAFFVNPAVLAVGEKKIQKWMKDDPRLLEYERALHDILRYAPHILDAEGEKFFATVNLCLGSHDEIYGVFKNADLRFGTIRGEDGKPMQLTDSNYVPCLMSQNRRVRRAAFNKLYETYGQFRNSFAGLMNGFVREKTTVASLRNFPNSLEASVFADEVPSNIYNNLISTVNENLSVLYNYYDLKREVLGLSHLHLYDVYAPMVGEASRSYSFEEAVDTVLRALSLLGKDYTDTLGDGIRNRGWVDVYPNRGKRGGAYSAGCYDTEPYILLNYEGKQDDVSTLAHEAGHSMHSYYSRHNNPPQTSEYTIFVAEVASTVNELILSRYLLSHAESSAERLAILNQRMETFKGTLFRQTMFAEFEKEMHALSEQGEILTADLLCERYYELVKRYFGKRVVCDSQIACEWMRIPHFYYNFYVYKYATCISAASSIVRRMEEQGEAYIAKYLDFLKCGGSRSPLDSLKVADIDLTDPQVIRDAIGMFGDTVRQFREEWEAAKKN